MRDFFKEFETFAVRGNAVDLAVGVVIGAAFNQITTSLANNIITPPIGLLLGGVNFSGLAIPLPGGSAIQYGIFLQSIINFVIIAFALFLFVKAFNRFARRSADTKKKEGETPSPELLVLTEIRNELRDSRRT